MIVMGKMAEKICYISMFAGLNCFLKSSCVVSRHYFQLSYWSHESISICTCMTYYRSRAHFTISEWFAIGIPNLPSYPITQPWDVFELNVRLYLLFQWIILSKSYAFLISSRLDLRHGSGSSYFCHSVLFAHASSPRHLFASSFIAILSLDELEKNSTSVL